MPERRPRRIGIVGALSLLGKEVGDVLSKSALAADRVRLLDDGETEEPDSGRRIIAFADEPALADPVTRENLRDLDLVFFTGTRIHARTYGREAAADGAAVIDLTSGLEPARQIWVVPHPAAPALALLLQSLARPQPWAAAAATVYEPASERGLAGIEELRAQSLNLLSLQPLPTRVFGVQIAYNLRERLGEETDPSLEEIETEIARDLARLATAAEPAPFPLPALRLLQAPLFHAGMISLFIQFASDPGPEALRERLGRAGVRLLAPEEEPPDVVSPAATDEVHVSAPRRDRSVPGGYWILAAFDNLRRRARAAVRLAELALGAAA